MEEFDLARFRRKLANLAASPETSEALRTYLNAAVSRDPVDVMNEIDVLAQLCPDCAKREGEP